MEPTPANPGNRERFLSFASLLQVVACSLLLLQTCRGLVPLSSRRWYHGRNSGKRIAYRISSSLFSKRIESVEGDDEIRLKGSAASTQTRHQQWITCSSTKELAHAAKTLVKPNDVVAELGAQLREVSTAICQTLETGQGHAVLVDTLRKFPKENTNKREALEDQGDGQTHIAVSNRTRAMRRDGDEESFFPDCCTFHAVAQLDHWRQAFFPLSGTLSRYDVLVLDVNSIIGNDLEWTTLSIIREFIALNGSHDCLVLVKSLSLNQWASRLIHGQRWCTKQKRQSSSSSQRTQLVQNNHARAFHVIATVGVQEYRNTIPYTVRPGDAVLEIGCHLGTSTALIHAAASSNHQMGGYCIGVDIGSKIVRGAQLRHPEVFFREGDAWRTATLLRIQQEYYSSCDSTERISVTGQIGFDVVYVDVGGLSGQDGLIEALSLVSALANALEPRCIVLKSLCMRRLSSLLTPYWLFQKQNESNAD